MHIRNGRTSAIMSMTINMMSDSNIGKCETCKYSKGNVCLSRENWGTCAKANAGAKCEYWKERK